MPPPWITLRSIDPSTITTSRVRPRSTHGKPPDQDSSASGPSPDRWLPPTSQSTESIAYQAIFRRKLCKFSSQIAYRLFSGCASSDERTDDGRCRRRGSTDPGPSCPPDPGLGLRASPRSRLPAGGGPVRCLDGRRPVGRREQDLVQGQVRDRGRMRVPGGRLLRPHHRGGRPDAARHPGFAERPALGRQPPRYGRAPCPLLCRGAAGPAVGNQPRHLLHHGPDAPRGVSRARPAPAPGSRPDRGGASAPARGEARERVGCEPSLRGGDGPAGERAALPAPGRDHHRRHHLVGSGYHAPLRLALRQGGAGLRSGGAGRDEAPRFRACRRHRGVRPRARGSDPGPGRSGLQLPALPAQGWRLGLHGGLAELGSGPRSPSSRPGTSRRCATSPSARPSRMPCVSARSVWPSPSAMAATACGIGASRRGRSSSRSIGPRCWATGPGRFGRTSPPGTTSFTRTIPSARSACCATISRAGRRPSNASTGCGRGRGTISGCWPGGRSSAGTRPGSPCVSSGRISTSPGASATSSASRIWPCTMP